MLRGLAIAALFMWGTAAAGGGPWLDVVPLDSGLAVEVDISSFRQGLLGPEARLRVSAGEQQLPEGQPFRSFVGSVRFDCERSRIVPMAVTYFAQRRGTGPVLASESDLAAPGIRPDLMADVPEEATATLLRAACAVL